jgi:hypothetical protein
MTPEQIAYQDIEDRIRRPWTYRARLVLRLIVCAL